jgi:hypothetical protein
MRCDFLSTKYKVPLRQAQDKLKSTKTKVPFDWFNKLTLRQAQGDSFVAIIRGEEKKQRALCALCFFSSPLSLKCNLSP